MSSISKCASFVIGLPTCPRREWRRVCGYALVVARRFGYRRNRLPHRPRSVLAAWISTVYPSAKSPRDRRHLSGASPSLANRLLASRQPIFSPAFETRPMRYGCAADHLTIAALPFGHRSLRAARVPAPGSAARPDQCGDDRRGRASRRRRLACAAVSPWWITETDQ